MVIWANDMSFLMMIVFVLFSSFLSISQVTKTTCAGTKILNVLSITETNELNFGSIGVLSTLGGTCVLSPNGTRIATMGVHLSQNDPYSNAEYIVTGESSYSYIITLPCSITVVHSNNLYTIQITNISSICASSGSVGVIGVLNSQSGSDTFKIGGTLNVAAGQYSGIYKGTFDVAVAYN